MHKKGIKKGQTPKVTKVTKIPVIIKKGQTPKISPKLSPLYLWQENEKISR